MAAPLEPLSSHGACSNVRMRASAFAGGGVKNTSQSMGVLLTSGALCGQHLETIWNLENFLMLSYGRENRWAPVMDIYLYGIISVRCRMPESFLKQIQPSAYNHWKLQCLPGYWWRFLPSTWKTFPTHIGKDQQLANACTATWKLK